MQKRRSPLWIVLGILIIALGFYMGWVALSGSTQNEDGKLKANVSLTVNPEKAQQDASKVGHLAGEATEKTLDKLKIRKGTSTGPGTAAGAK